MTGHGVDDRNYICGRGRDFRYHVQSGSILTKPLTELVTQKLSPRIKQSELDADHSLSIGAKIKNG